MQLLRLSACTSRSNVGLHKLNWDDGPRPEAPALRRTSGHVLCAVRLARQARAVSWRLATSLAFCQ